MKELVALAIRPSLRDMTSLSLIMCGKGCGIPNLMNLEGKCDYIDLHFECLCKNVDNSIFNPEICDNYIIISKKGTVT